MSEEHAVSPSPEPAAPVVPAPAPEPAAPAPAPEAPPVAAPEPAAEAPAAVPEAPAAEPPAAPQPEPGFLTKPPESDGEKAAEEPKAEAEQPTPVEEVKYEFTLPEGMQLDPARVEPLTKWLQEHGVPPGEKAQELMNMHVEAMQALAKHAVDEQWRAFEESRITKRTEAMSDPVFGGAGFQTNATAAERVMSLFLQPQERAELYRRLDASGMSDDVYLARLLLGVARKFAEPAPPPPNASPLPPREAAGRAPRGQGSIYRYPRGNRAG